MPKTIFYCARCRRGVGRLKAKPVFKKHKRFAKPKAFKCPYCGAFLKLRRRK